MMNQRNEMTRVARELSKRLNGKGYASIGRDEVTQVTRTTLDQPKARLGTARAKLLDEALADQGVRSVPKLAHTRSGESIRLVRTGTLVSHLVDVILLPSVLTDRELAHIVTKLKNRWDWGEQEAAV
jgi:hypothetical protein